MRQARPGQVYVVTHETAAREGVAKVGDEITVLQRNTSLSGSAAAWCSFICKRTNRSLDLSCEDFDAAIASGALTLKFDTAAGLHAAEFNHHLDTIASLRHQLAIAQLANAGGQHLAALA